MSICLPRRKFIARLAAASTSPFATYAQPPQRMRRVGVLMNLAADDPESAARIAALAQGLGEPGWAIGRNVQIEYR